MKIFWWFSGNCSIEFSTLELFLITKQSLPLLLQWGKKKPKKMSHEWCFISNKSKI